MAQGCVVTGWMNEPMDRWLAGGVWTHKSKNPEERLLAEAVGRAGEARRRVGEETPRQGNGGYEGRWQGKWMNDGTSL